MYGIGPVNLFSYTPRNPLSIAIPLSNVSEKGNSNVTVTSSMAPLGVVPLAVETMFYLDANNVVKGAYKQISTPTIESVDDNDMLTGGKWHYSERYIEATYARLGIENLIPSWKLPPLSGGVTFRYRTQDYIDDYNSPSRTSGSVDLAFKASWPKKNSLTAALHDLGSRFKGSEGSTDPADLGVYLEDEYSVHKDDYSFLNINANANLDCNAGRISQVNLSAKGSLKYVGQVDLTGQLGVCYDGGLHPVIGAAVAYDGYSLSTAVRFSQELGATIMGSFTMNVGKKADKTAGSTSADKENKGVK